MRPAALCLAGQTKSKRTKTTSTGTSFKKNTSTSPVTATNIAAHIQSTLFAYEREKTGMRVDHPRQFMYLSLLFRWAQIIRVPWKQQ